MTCQLSLYPSWMPATTNLWPIVTKTDGMSVRAAIMYISLVRVFLSSCRLGGTDLWAFYGETTLPLSSWRSIVRGTTRIHLRSCYFWSTSTVRACLVPLSEGPMIQCMLIHSLCKPIHHPENYDDIQRDTDAIHECIKTLLALCILALVARIAQWNWVMCCTVIYWTRFSYYYLIISFITVCVLYWCHYKEWFTNWLSDHSCKKRSIVLTRLCMGNTSKNVHTKSSLYTLHHRSLKGKFIKHARYTAHN